MLKCLHICKQWLVLNYELYLDGRRLLDAIPRPGYRRANYAHHLMSDIIRRYHVIEKGLSMPEFRPLFGKEVVLSLVRDIKEWKGINTRKERIAEEQIAVAYSVLNEYKRRHDELGFDVKGLVDDIAPNNADLKPIGGIKNYTPANPQDAAAFTRVVFSRSSVRSFDPQRIPQSASVTDAVETALRAPSVCNRQTARVHIYTGEQVKEVLQYQNGNRGFGHRIPMVLVVTSDLRYFTGVHERNQAGIDAGMFSMLLILALHSKGIGTVALNWSVLNKQDQRLRGTADIPEHERIIMLIGCGHPEKDTVVTISRRRSADDTVTFH